MSFSMVVGGVSGQCDKDGFGGDFEDGGSSGSMRFRR